MAEKEERILVLKATEDDFIYKHFNGKGFIPRQEAINRMAKSIEYNLNGSSFNSLAEAALNVLLEG